MVNTPDESEAGPEPVTLHVHDSVLGQDTTFGADGQEGD